MSDVNLMFRKFVFMYEMDKKYCKNKFTYIISFCLMIYYIVDKKKSSNCLYKRTCCTRMDMKPYQWKHCRVICLTCKATYNRFYIQEKLLNENEINYEDTANMIRPDGDVDISQEFIKNFTPPTCDSCNGTLKPDIIFFGDNVPKDRVNFVKTKVSESDSLLVLGSSLSVFSGYRIILQAIEEKKDICIVNIGPTRADKLVNLKIEARCGDILPKIRR